MPYLIPILYVIVSYTFFLLPGLFDQVVELQIISALLPFLMGVERKDCHKRQER